MRWLAVVVAGTLLAGGCADSSSDAVSSAPASADRVMTCAGLGPDAAWEMQKANKTWQSFSAALDSSDEEAARRDLRELMAHLEDLGEIIEHMDAAGCERMLEVARENAETLDTMVLAARGLLDR
ncbi:MAG: hypothetical protein OXH86_07085 [Acidimicrobiaceae bacterium]|uniref:hypothetical protein n=1 Tax=Candidatus Poriferisodalis multihospitum TaxID=2983191 RepID=UPI0023830D4A|nr:hypothetical protein [Candidatus Poriferisodalis multihospitum]MDE0497099.1 hypothetical protein [Acidimicrobiaceae bacterium]